MYQPPRIVAAEHREAVKHQSPAFDAQRRTLGYRSNYTSSTPTAPASQSMAAAASCYIEQGVIVARQFPASDDIELFLRE